MIYYLSSPSQDVLTSMLVVMQGNKPTFPYQNVIGPSPATAAIAAGVDANGNATAAVAAAGIPGQWYMSINTTLTLPAYPFGVFEDDTNGQAVLGTWAS